MTIAPIAPVAVQVQKPLNPTVNDEFRTDVVPLPGGHVELAPGHQVPNGLRDAVLAAAEVARSEKVAIGVFQSHGIGGPSAFSFEKLALTKAGGLAPLNLEFDPSGPMGGPYTDRFEVTAEGAGAADGPALQAIVGAETFAGMVRGFDGSLVSLDLLR